LVTPSGFFSKKNDNLLLGGAITILKNMSSSMGRIIPYMKWKIKNVPNHQPVWHDSGLLPLKLHETAIKRGWKTPG
jgi:hypothetical protein